MSKSMAEAMHTSEISVDFYWTTLCYSAEDHAICSHNHENLKSKKEKLLFYQTWRQSQLAFDPEREQCFKKIHHILS
jgi:hypothetical protein